MQHFHKTIDTYTIAFAAFILSAGALGDRIGAKRVFVAGFAIFTCASLACALSPTLPILIAARAIQGLAAAVLVPNSLALLNHTYTDDAGRSRAVGIWSAGASVALTAGPLVGGALIALFGWRSIFLVNLPIGLTGLWLAWRFATDTTRHPSHTIDLPGQVAAVASLGVLAATLIGSGAFGARNPWIVAGAVASIVSIALFIIREGRAEQPMLPLGLFENKTFSSSLSTGVLVNTAFYGLIFVFSLFMQRIMHLSPLKAGLGFVPMLGACVITNLLAAPVSKRIGAQAAIIAGASIMAVGCMLLWRVDGHSSYEVLALPFVLLGGGIGLLVPPLTTGVLGSVDKRQSGIASGALNAARQTGSVIGVSLFGSLVANPRTVVHGVHAALLISLGVLIATCACIWMGMTSRK